MRGHLDAADHPKNFMRSPGTNRNSPTLRFSTRLRSVNVTTRKHMRGPPPVPLLDEWFLFRRTADRQLMQEIDDLLQDLATVSHTWKRGGMSFGLEHASSEDWVVQFNSQIESKVRIGVIVMEKRPVGMQPDRHNI
ncbi:hypothetical protein PROFUN_12862 [Planoprotostelium fungivorum]|uniref:Uncharacterized protein n=1 Tax=Planoprotostelium fungivorum TaxID=1890364 RepID=A0A2P6N6B5_9EUKA|nr:hypothetical protein PROFUN_12862 [Planoprotostelium fungivorum]